MRTILLLLLLARPALATQFIMHGTPASGRPSGFNSVYADLWVSAESGSNGDGVTTNNLNSATVMTPGLGYWTVFSNTAAKAFIISNNETAFGLPIYGDGTIWTESGAHGWAVSDNYLTNFAQFNFNQTYSNASFGFYWYCSADTADDSTRDMFIVVAPGEFFSCNVIFDTGGNAFMRPHTQAGTSTGVHFLAGTWYWITGKYAYNDGAYFSIYDVTRTTLIGSDYKAFMFSGNLISQIQFGRCDVHPNFSTALYGFDNILVDVTTCKYPLGLANDYTPPPGTLGFGPSTYNFGSTTVGTSNTVTINITNTTAGSLSLSGTASTNNAVFHIVSGGSFTLQPLQTAAIVVSYAPTGAGSDSGTLTLTGGGGGTVSLSGTGVAACNTVEGQVSGSSDLAQAVGDLSANGYVAWQFVASNTVTMCKMVLNMSVVGSPNYNITLHIYGNSGGNHPNVAIDTSTTSVAANTVSSATTFLTSAPLVNGTAYWGVLVCSGGSGAGAFPTGDGGITAKLNCITADYPFYAAFQLSSDGTTWNNTFNQERGLATIYSP